MTANCTPGVKDWTVTRMVGENRIVVEVITESREDEIRLTDELSDMLRGGPRATD
jgi:hypothetical protein